jgi:hypothetical protein
MPAPLLIQRLRIHPEKLHGTARPELIVGYQDFAGAASLPLAD